MEKADKMSVINTFIDQDVNSMIINDPIKKYLGCQQHRKKTNTTFLTTSELLKCLSEQIVESVLLFERSRRKRFRPLSSLSPEL